MSKTEFQTIWKSLLAQPLAGRPRDENEVALFMSEYYRTLHSLDAALVRLATERYLAAPACEHCRRHSGRMPLAAELAEIARAELRSRQPAAPVWPKGYDVAKAIHGGPGDETYQPRCGYCNDTGFRDVERNGKVGVKRCECMAVSV